MNAFECGHEGDVLLAVDTGRWPNRTDADLREHVAVCAICQEVVAVGEAFREVNDASSPRLPESSLVWWRAKIRAREDATRLAARPITVAQAVAFASIVGLLSAWLGATSSLLQRGLYWLGRVAARFDPRGLSVPEGLQAVVTEHAVWFVAVGVCVMLTSIVAVYFVMREN